jgi:hypothetical protein
MLGIAKRASKIQEHTMFSVLLPILFGLAQPQHQLQLHTQQSKRCYVRPLLVIWQRIYRILLGTPPKWWSFLSLPSVMPLSKMQEMHRRHLGIGIRKGRIKKGMRLN